MGISANFSNLQINFRALTELKYTFTENLLIEHSLTHPCLPTKTHEKIHKIPTEIFIYSAKMRYSLPGIIRMFMCTILGEILLDQNPSILSNFFKISQILSFACYHGKTTGKRLLIKASKHFTDIHLNKIHKSQK